MSRPVLWWAIRVLAGGVLGYLPTPDQTDAVWPIVIAFLRGLP